MRSHLIGDEHFYGFLRHIKDLCRLWCSTEVFRIIVDDLKLVPKKATLSGLLSAINCFSICHLDGIRPSNPALAGISGRGSRRFIRVDHGWPALY